MTRERVISGLQRIITEKHLNYEDALVLRWAAEYVSADRREAFDEAAKMVENMAYVEYQAGAKAPSQESVRGILSQAASAIRQHAKGDGK